MYVRNPPGSMHRPSSEAGCTILVKLRQMHADDREVVRVDTRRSSRWLQGRPGERVLTLYSGFGENVCMLQWDAGARFPDDCFDRGAEYYVVRGSFRDECGSYGEGAWLRLPAGSRQSIRVDRGCTVYRKTGHLP
jgi:anti-sigma factor ChrR (cupin superfamily)